MNELLQFYGRVKDMEGMEFIEKVKGVFSESNQTERYLQFACALKDFKTHKIGDSEVVSTAKIVFEGHEDLFQQFIKFLPPDLKKIQVQEFQAIAFVNKVRSRFGIHNDLGVYRSFLDNMCKYKRKAKPIAEVYEEMFDLFHGHADLIHEFEGFLDDNDKSVLKEINKKKVFALSDRNIEIDILLSNMDATKRHLEVMLEGREDCPNRDFKQVELRCFERLYAEYAPAVIEKMKESPQECIPRVLSRLKEKEEELRRVRKLSNEFWAELHHLRKQRKIQSKTI